MCSPGPTQVANTGKGKKHSILFSEFATSTNIEKRRKRRVHTLKMGARLQKLNLFPNKAKLF